MSSQKIEKICLLHQIIEDWSCPWYIKQDIFDMIEHLNVYKLDNLLDNIDEFKEFIEMIDEENTQQIAFLAS